MKGKVAEGEGMRRESRSISRSKVKRKKESEVCWKLRLSAVMRQSDAHTQ